MDIVWQISLNTLKIFYLEINWKLKMGVIN